MSNDVLFFAPDGTLNLDFGLMGEHFREPVCPKCEQPIRWVLDMFSFTTGPRPQLAHARCTWQRGAFTREGNLAYPDE